MIRAASVQRNSHRIIRLGIFAAAVLALVLFGIGFVMFDSGARELLLNDRPEARVDAYLSAASRGDASAALAAWELDARERPGLADRRARVTAALIAARPPAYRIVKTEWWTTCCDPQLIDGPRNAGLVASHSCWKMTT